MQPLTARTSALLLTLVALLKLSYLFDYSGLPFLWGPVFDSVVYRAQAEAVLAGRHGDPTLLAFSPLYGYLLAGVGVAPPIKLALFQVALGVLNTALVARIGRALFGPAAGLCAATLFVGYGLFTFYESKVLSETLGLTLLLLSLFFLTSESTRVRVFAAPTLLAGALLGLAILSRASLLFVGFATVASALMPWAPADPLKRRLQRVAWLAIGLAAPLVAHGLFTLAHTGFFVPVIFVSRTAAAAARVGDAWRGDLSALSPRASGEVSAWDVVDQARARLAAGPDAAQPSPPLDLWGVLSGAPVKLADTLRDIETTFDYGFYGERSEVPTLYAFPVSFGLLMLFAGFGAALLARERALRSAWPLAGLVLGTLATTALFHPSSRYRLPLALALALVGGAAVPAIARLERVRLRSALSAVLVVGALALGARHATRGLSAPAWWHVRVAESAVEAGDAALATERVRAAALLAPSDSALQRRIEALSRRGGLPPPPRPH